MLFLYAAGEVFIRMTKEYQTPKTIRMESLQYAPALFARIVFPQLEQNNPDDKWSINSLGYRGAEFSEEKVDGTVRIMIFGGSTVFDQNVPKGKHWPAKNQNILASQGLTNIQVINAGIPGLASFESLGRLFSEGHLFKPDYVILYNAWNDIKYFPNEASLLRTMKPYDESKEFRSNYHRWIDQLLGDTSQLYVRLRALYFSWKYNVGDEGFAEHDKDNGEILDSNLNQYRLTIEMFVDLAKNIQAVPILTTQARLITNNNTELERSRIGYKYQKLNHQNLVKAFKKTDVIALSVAESKGVPMINISNEMTGNGEYFSDHVHLSGKGSIRVAQIVTTQLAVLINQQ